MSRHRYLMAYDIADQKRLRQICTIMEDHGQRLQYSVFLCDLTLGELADLQTKIVTTINTTADSVIQIDLGPNTSPAPIHTIGRPRQLPTTGPHVI